MRRGDGLHAHVDTFQRYSGMFEIQNLRQAFCWLCGAATGYTHTWTEISGHSLRAVPARRPTGGVTAAQRNVKRYMHYHTRWCAHADRRHAVFHVTCCMP